jgi:hypothetical protein
MALPRLVLSNGLQSSAEEFQPLFAAKRKGSSFQVNHFSSQYPALPGFSGCKFLQ